MDKRILKNPISGFDGEKALTYLFVSAKGYFGNCFEDFNDLSKATFGTLMRLKNGAFSPDENGKDLYIFFLPEDSVDTEPEYRPYSICEFLSVFPLLSSITFREKKTGFEYTMCFLGYTKKQDKYFVALGTQDIDIDELLKRYEVLDPETKQFAPFGHKVSQGDIR